MHPWSNAKMKTRLSSSGYISFHSIKSGKLKSIHLDIRTSLIIMFIYLTMLCDPDHSFYLWKFIKKTGKVTQQWGRMLNGKGRKSMVRKRGSSSPLFPSADHNHQKEKAKNSQPKVPNQRTHSFSSFFYLSVISLITVVQTYLPFPT